MQIQTTGPAKSELKLTIEVEPGEYQKYLILAAKKITANSKIPGFRPGTASYDIVKQKFGEAEIMKEALNDIITNTFIASLKEKKLNTVGSPEINITKMAPGNPLIYTATVSLMPEVELATLDKITIRKEKVKVEDKEVDKVLADIANSRAKKIAINEPAQEKNLVKMDYNITIDNISQEDGQAKDFSVYLGEKHMVPGFEEKIIGLKTGNKKKFDITFPKSYFQPNFAGKTCQFEVDIKGVFKLEVPEINDKFVSELGSFKNVEELKKQIKDNLIHEKSHKQERQLEGDMIDSIIKASKFTDIPAKMIDNEIESIIHELKHDLESKGLTFDTWLQNMGKKEDEFKKELRPQAESRVKGAIIVKKVAEEQKLSATNEEVKKEITNTKAQYQTNPEIVERLESPDYKNYLFNVLTGKKVMDYLKSQTIQE